MAKRPVPQYDFKAFGAAIKAARTGRKESRKAAREYEKLQGQKEALYADYGKLKNRLRSTTLSSGT